ncbi:MAG: GGDEF domain-containing protein [Thiobacillus sp.]|nr:GGDEF domain-containing protein [Thiobacillus sp.]
MVRPIANNNDVASQIMDLLSLFDSWLLARHQWIVQCMRCLVTDEVRPSQKNLPNFASLPGVELPGNLRHELTTTIHQLEMLWDTVISASHQREAQSLTHVLDHFQILDHFQMQAERFMREAEQASKLLWQDFALRDPLTGARTRLTLKSHLLDALCRFKRGTPSTLILLDQDNFKAINDQWGHLAGDEVLITMANQMSRHLRAEDILFRYGGDEWLILLKGTERDKASLIANRLRDSVRTLSFSANNFQLYYTDLSYGIAAPQPFDTPETWIARADLALYSMKRQRRGGDST